MVMALVGKLAIRYWGTQETSARETIRCEAQQDLTGHRKVWAMSQRGLGVKGRCAAAPSVASRLGQKRYLRID